MSKSYWKYASIFFGILFLLNIFISAVNAHNSRFISIDYNRASNINDNYISQTTSVSQLSDISPSDWYFRDMQQLVEDWDCISGYPDGTYRANLTIVRAEAVANIVLCVANLENRELSKLEDLENRINNLKKQ